MMTTLRCQICNSQDTKYKCTACRTPSCSLPCFKQHKAACAELQAEQSPALPSVPTQIPVAPSADAKPPILEQADLRDLFHRYPNLQSQLREVYRSTRDPSDVPQNRERRDVSHRYWNPEKGFSKGLSVLRRLAEDDSANSEGVAAFMKLLADKSTV